MTYREEFHFIIGGIIAAVMMAWLFEMRQPTWNYAFYMQQNDQKALAVKPYGQIEFGQAYTADTLRQLLDGLSKMRQSGDCHETGYRIPLGDPDADGVVRIYPGPAFRQPPRNWPRLFR